MYQPHDIIDMLDKQILINRSMEFLEKNQDKISWDYLCKNEGINELNYKFLKERMDIIREDLMKAVYHPKRLGYYLELGYDIFDE